MKDKLSKKKIDNEIKYLEKKTKWFNKLWHVAMWLIIIAQILFLIFNPTIQEGIVLGFIFGMWFTETLRRIIFNKIFCGGN